MLLPDRACRLTGGKHTLHEILYVAENYPVAFWVSGSLGRKWLDLNTLANWDWKFILESIGIVEDCTIDESFSLGPKRGCYIVLTRVHPE
jgi:hypothetical protein